MWPFKKKEERELTADVGDLLLRALIGSGEITKEQAMNIPAVTACLGIISDTIASLPVLLYKEGEGKVSEVKDERVELLNDDTGDTLDGFQFKKAMVEDYLLNGAGYSYINRERNRVKSIHYVENRSVSVNINTDPIFKSYDILINGTTYRDFEFIKLTRKSKDGITGVGIIEENNKMLSVAYNTLIFEELLVKTGGNKKGFLKSANRLSKDAIEDLKLAWKELYSNDNSENVVVLNNGLDFKEASNTSVEMQLNENKKTNATEICKLFVVPESILSGKASDSEYNNWIKVCILPILIALQTAFNKDLLLPSEKGSFYFAFDTRELLKGDIEKRFRAYEIAIKNKFFEINDVRFLEDLSPIEAFNDMVVLGLNDVLYNIKTGEVYTPNTDKTTNMNDQKKSLGGGEDDANRNSGQSGIA